MTLTATVRDQARALAELTDEAPPWAPSLAIVYWLYGNARRSDRSWPKIAQYMRPLVSDIGDLPAIKLTPLAWAEHRERRKATPSERTGRQICDATLNNALGRTKEMLDWTVEGKLLKYNPLSSARAVATVSRRETWLPPGDVDRLLAACPHLVDKRLPEGKDDGLRARVMRAFVLACHDSMLRFTEAQTLLRGRIGQDGRVELASRQTKGRKRRVVFLTPRTLAAIAELPPGAFVFQDPDKPGPLHERRIHYWFRQLCKLAGVDALVAPGEERLRPHDLRASGASTADENGARPTAIRDALGHSRLATTEVYLRSGKADNARSVTAVMAAVVRRPALRAPRGQMTTLRKTPKINVASSKR